MLTLITLIILILWYFYNTIGIIGITLINIYLFWIFYGSSKSTKKIIESKEEQIIHHLRGRMHYDYIKENSLYFLYPAASKQYAQTCSIWGIGCFILGIIAVFKQNWVSLIFCIIFCITSFVLSGKFTKPMSDYQLAEKRDNFIVKLRLEEYLEFFASKWRTL